jgi:hypothetical protein
MPPSSLPVGVQVEATVARKREEEKAQGGDDNDDGNVIDPSYRDKHDLSAIYIIQQASLHSMFSKIHNVDWRLQ